MQELNALLDRLGPEAAVLIGLMMVAVAALWARDIVREKLFRDLLRENTKAQTEAAAAKLEMATRLSEVLQELLLLRQLMMFALNRENGEGD